ncbi:GNAT family N-acetyltransferase [Halobacillus sp. ACCC02827]|uniref:GNAT family N-acetyltransferase n=1 Tax=Bacillaceae TaxID=186817 RepID=UPI0002A4D7E4|nr:MULTISPECIES: GNAT family N-acetyltransferase [Bacillaceae]ELK44512.1 hypothetical protein D479_18764 [Halobacillus sp. BAB-2008]QHT46805.1 GNAT family N-acetyltransferase [Bacillus sp. SB49]WJE14025.1 GNAT family N-acetyltransferase [Halobacillus sp. ACCC02827]
MNKWLYGYDKMKKKYRHIHIRPYEEKDFETLINIQKKAFPPPFPSDLWWTKEQLSQQLAAFPTGCLCIEVEGTIAGSMTAMQVHLDDDKDHTWKEITADGSMETHDPEGDTLYVVDLCVDPDFRSLGLGRQLTQAMYEIVIQFGLTRLVGGARMPLYHKYSHEWTAEEYVNLVIASEIQDPVLTFLLKSGRSPIRPVPGYLEDAESCNYGLLTEWKNPFL